MTTTTQRRYAGYLSSALFFSGAMALLSACGGSASSNGAIAEPEPTLLVSQENAAELLLQSRVALELLPRLQRNANILISSGFPFAPTPPCGNPEGHFSLIVEDGLPVSATLEQCQDALYTSRTFDGRIDFDFSDPGLAYSKFSAFSHHINFGEQGVLLELDGAFSIRPEDPNDSFGIALIENVRAIARSTDTGEVDGNTRGMEYLGFAVRFDSNVHFDETPFATLAGGGAIAIDAFDGHIVRVSTPEDLVDPQDYALCYGMGTLRVEGVDGSYAQWHFDNGVLAFTVNGETLEDDVCAGEIPPPASEPEPEPGPGGGGGSIRH